MTNPHQPALTADGTVGQVPPDRGLTGLGLLMQLGGMLGIMLGAFVIWTMMVIFLNSRGASGVGGVLLKILLVAAASMVRSVLHWRAGSALLYGGLDGAIAPLRKYVMFSLAQSVIVLVLVSLTLDDLMRGVEMPWLSMAVALLTWPAVMGALVLSKPWAKEPMDALGEPEDKGVEAASVLMVVFGAMGVIMAVLLLVGMIQLDAGGGLEQILLVGLAALLVARSGIHLRAGLCGLRSTNRDEFAHASTSYVNLGMISGICAGAIFLIIGMKNSGGSGGGAGIMLAFTVLLVWMLIMWPRIIGRFVRERTFNDLLDSAPAVGPRSADMGLTALGWLLLALGAEPLLGSLVSLVGAPELSQDLLMTTGVFSMGAVGGDTLEGLLTLVGAALQCWAGYELIHMSARARLSGTVYGVVGVVTAVIANREVFTSLDSAGADAMQLGLGGGSFMALGALAAALVLPVAALLLVRRPPVATARVVRRP